MSESTNDQANLRAAIVGRQVPNPPAVRSRPRRLRWRDRSHAARLRAIVGGGLVAAGLALTVLLGTPAPEAEAPETLAAAATRPDQGIVRPALPRPPGVRQVVSADPVVTSGLSAIIPEIRMARVGGGAALDAAALLSDSNRALAELFSNGGLSFAPITHRSLADWPAGACGARSIPVGPAYCAIETALYSGETVARRTGALLAFAGVMSTHIEEQMGLALAPVSPELRALRQDCLAGVWARHQSEARTWLYPERLARHLAETKAYRAEARSRAFRAGYLGEGPLTCSEVSWSGEDRN